MKKTQRALRAARPDLTRDVLLYLAEKLTDWRSQQPAFMHLVPVTPEHRTVFRRLATEFRQRAHLRSARAASAPSPSRSIRGKKGEGRG